MHPGMGLQQQLGHKHHHSPGWQSSHSPQPASHCCRLFSFVSVHTKWTILLTLPHSHNTPCICSHNSAHLPSTSRHRVGLVSSSMTEAGLRVALFALLSSTWRWAGLSWYCSSLRLSSQWSYTVSSWQLKPTAYYPSPYLSDQVTSSLSKEWNATWCSVQSLISLSIPLGLSTVHRDIQVSCRTFSLTLLCAYLKISDNNGHVFLSKCTLSQSDFFGHRDTTA